MARWVLKDAHYLNVPGTEWEYQETDRDTGRRLRKIYTVPLYLNPKNEEDWNYREEACIIVSHRFDPQFRRDIVFAGPPTPDMEPIDDEAEKISQGYIDSGAWKHPIESLNMTYSESRLSEFERAIAELAVKTGTVQVTPNVSTSGADQKRLDSLEQMVKLLMDQNASLQAQVLEKPKAGIRRI